MAYTALSASVKCPYYVKDNPKACTITCEGYAGCKNVQSNFRNKKQLTAKVNAHCQTNYTECDLYQIAAKKY